MNFFAFGLPVFTLATEPTACVASRLGKRPLIGASKLPRDVAVEEVAAKVCFLTTAALPSKESLEAGISATALNPSSCC